MDAWLLLPCPLRTKIYGAVRISTALFRKMRYMLGNAVELVGPEAQPKIGLPQSCENLGSSCQEKALKMGRL
jgi:hypothetical protein